MLTISFDVGGVLDEGAAMFLPLLEGGLAYDFRIIVVTAIGHGKPEKWGFTEQARYATSYSRLINRGYIQNKHFHELFVTPDPGGVTTAAYKDFVLRQERASLHVDDKDEIITGIHSCACLKYTTGIDQDEFLSAFWVSVREITRHTA